MARTWFITGASSGLGRSTTKWGIEGFCEAVANRAFPIPGDPAKMVRAIVVCVDGATRALRLPLGSDTYGLLRGVSAERLAAPDAAKEIAHSTDGTMIPAG